MSVTTAPHPVATRRVAVERFEAMGTHAEVQVVDGDPATLDAARQRIAELEARWSRFRAQSDVSRLNDRAGSWVPVAPATITLLDRAVAAARATDGRFDPTVGGALLSHGYDRTFRAVAPHARHLRPHPVVDGSWPQIETDRASGMARVPEGTVFDPGGIGKGLAADLVVEELATDGSGLLVSIGGDLRVVGLAPDPSGWVISIDDPFDRRAEIGGLAIASGAMATSSRLDRTWTTADGPAHHVIDPRTGRPAETEVVAVTVIAAEAWWAEAHATSLLLAGPSALDEADESLEAVLVLADGTVHTSAALAGMVAERARAELAVLAS